MATYMDINTAYSSFLLLFLQNNSRPSSDMAKFRECFSKAKHIVVLTGAGVSAESGVPTFRGAGGLWRKWKAQVKEMRFRLNYTGLSCFN